MTSSKARSPKPMTPQGFISAKTREEPAPEAIMTEVEELVGRLKEISADLREAEHDEDPETTAITLADADTVDQAAAALTRLAEERDKLAAKIYRPGVLRCAKCNFRLVSNWLNASDGTVSPRETTEHCPNDGAPMWKVSWEEECREADRCWEQQVDRALTAEARADWMEGDLERADRLIRRLMMIPIDEETHGGGAHDDACPDCATIMDAEGWLRRRTALSGEAE